MIINLSNNPTAAAILILSGVLITSVCILMILTVMNKRIRTYVTAMIPGFPSRDEDGNTIPRTRGQKIGMGVVLVVFAALLWLAFAP